jgi:hypothetical protein
MRFLGTELHVQDSVEALSPSEVRERGARGRFLALDDLLPLLRDPVTKEPLRRAGDRLESSTGHYELPAHGPQLFPCDVARLAAFLRDGRVLQDFSGLTPIEQYCAFGMLKASGNNNNLDHADVWYGRHLWRAARLMEGACGEFLDVGCDDVLLGRGVLPSDVRYAGLEPSPGAAARPRIAGYAEFLPLAAGTFDCISFQTSLDHVFDYHLALDEAARVLRPGGTLYLATLLWTQRAHLYTDTVHFHHFRAGQVEVALQPLFDVEELHAYNWKGNDHRVGVYARARKRV